MTLRSAALFAAVAMAVTVRAIPLAAMTVTELDGTAARAMARLTEPGALLVWGTVLAGLARAVGHRRQKD